MSPSTGPPRARWSSSAAAWGSEIVGLAPLEALLMAGKFYGAAGDDRALVQAAADRLGLGSIEPFVPEDKIIVYKINRG